MNSFRSYSFRRWISRAGSVTLIASLKDRVGTSREVLSITVEKNEKFKLFVAASILHQITESVE